MTEASARALLRRFGQFADQFARCFTRQAQRNGASHYLDALFTDSERKSMQAMHGRLSDPGSYEALQHGSTRWWTDVASSIGFGPGEETARADPDVGHSHGGERGR